MHKSNFWKGSWGSGYEKRKIVIDKKVDYYAELGLTHNATEEEIRRAFKLKMDAMPTRFNWWTFSWAPLMTNDDWYIYIRLDKALRVLTERRAEYDKARR